MSRVLVVTLLALVPSVGLARPTLPWFVGARRAKTLISASALLLDARAAALRRRDPLPGATPVSWRQLSREGTRGGLLLAPRVLSARLRALGVRRDGVVLVVGDTRRGWGEDGRVVWTLRAAGHRRAAIVDGGIAALRRAGVRRVARRARPTAGDFTARAPLRFAASMARVKASLAGAATKKKKKTVIIDARERREYDGARPYGERRGGHLPGAVHLHYKQLLAKDGTLLSRTAVRARLRRLGASRGATIISYCSAGVRSAWLTAALRHAGFARALNYAGSMWQWSAQPAAAYALVKR